MNKEILEAMRKWVQAEIRAAMSTDRGEELLADEEFSNVLTRIEAETTKE